jgi:guanosine-3',5'-bis(diphosphate) 3'-pyrophosphohydrolase
MSNLYEDALVMAINAHDGQRRQSGEPYVIHPIRVAKRAAASMGSKFTHGHVEVVKITAVLHDVLEDTDVPSCDIEAHFGAQVARAVELLSRPPKALRTQSYAQWIDTLIGTGNKIAIRVKHADVTDNLSDIDGLPEKVGLKPRYEKALSKLKKALIDG